MKNKTLNQHKKKTTDFYFQRFQIMDNQLQKIKQIYFKHFFKTKINSNTKALSYYLECHPGSWGKTLKEKEYNH